MKRQSTARWAGDLKAGEGKISLGSGAFEGPYSFTSRFEDGTGTNPEELLGAAHAGCFSMALALALATAGHVATSVETTATVQLTKPDGQLTISRIDLACTAVVPGISDDEFQRLAGETKGGCIVSRALASVPTHLTAALNAG